MKNILLYLLVVTSNICFAQTIHEAIKNDNLDQVKFLIEKNPELVSKNYQIEIPITRMPNEISPLFDAVLYGRYEIVKYLIGKGVDLKNNNDAIFLAVLQKGKKIKQLLIDSGARITNDTVPEEQFNILTKYITFFPSELKVCDELIKLGAGINMKWGKEGNYTHTPLGMATRGMNYPLVKLLVENGAKINLERNNGQIDLHDAIFYSGSIPPSGYSPEILNYLLEHGGDKSIRDNNGNLPVEYAALEGIPLALKILWDDSYNVKQTDYNGMTLLHRTVIRGYLDIVKFLISKKFDLNVKDNNGNTPLFYAYKYGHNKVANLLKENGANTDKMPNTEKIETLLSKPLKDGQAYIWYLGRQYWAIKTKNNLIIKPGNWGEVKPEDASLANGNIVPQELFGQNIILISDNVKYAETLVPNDAFLKTKSNEMNVNILTNNEVISKQLNAISIKYNEKIESAGISIRVDSMLNLLIESDGVKMMLSNYEKPKNKDFICAANNMDIAFLSVWGARGELPMEDVVEAEENIKILQPKVLFHQSLYTRSYFFQELSKQLKKRGCNCEIPVNEFRGDYFFYDASDKKNLIKQFGCELVN